MILECCCLPGKLQKQGKFVAYFVHKIDEIPAIFLTWELDWRPAKTRACVLRISALNKWCSLQPHQLMLQAKRL